MSNMFTFIAALAIAYSLPGADVIYILHTAGHGVSYGLAVAAGFALARACHVSLAAVGLATLLQTMPLTSEVVRFVGSLYLIWLGVGLLQSPAGSHGSVSKQAEPLRLSFTRIFQRAFFINLLNPKPLLFCSVLLPQFIQPGDGNVIGQFVHLGAILLVIGIAFDTLWALVGNQLGRWLDVRPKVKRTQQVLFALLLVGFGVELALMQAPSI